MTPIDVSLSIVAKAICMHDELTGDTRKIFVSNIKTVDESHSARVLIGCKPINDELTYNLLPISDFDEFGTKGCLKMQIK